MIPVEISQGSVKNRRRTGPMSTTGVNSKTFSIGALDSSSGGGSNNVTRFAMLIYQVAMYAATWR